MMHSSLKVGATLSFVFVLAVCVGCGEDAKPAAGPTEAVESVNLVGAASFSAAVSAGAMTPDRDNAAVVLAEKARVGTVPSSQTGERDLSIAVVGTEATIMFDVTGDGSPNSVYTFVTAVDEVTFIAWEAGGLCNLGWIEGELAFHILATCGGGAEVIACTNSAGVDTHACNVCRSEVCEACTVTGTNINCPDEMPDPEPESGALCDPPCTGGAMCVEGECVGGVDPEPDAEAEPSPDPTPAPEPDGPVAEGECSEECLGQSGAVCCTACGCEGEILCAPVCGSGFVWDCEIGCCYNYDTRECE